MKCDYDFFILGFIKVRGGIYEVLKFVESFVIKEGFFIEEDSYVFLVEEWCKKLFFFYFIVVGFIGNLGLSIGIISVVFGFNVIVYMLVDVKKWKKDLFCLKGVIVIEY